MRRQIAEMYITAEQPQRRLQNIEERHDIQPVEVIVGDMIRRQETYPRV